MSTEYLTIKEASERYQKAEITIRRLVRRIVKESQEAERVMVRPSKGEVTKLKKKRSPFSYTVSTKVLEKYYGAQEEAKDEADHKEQAKPMSQGEFVDLLRVTNQGMQDQLKVKDEQIRALNQALDDLGERQRETNVLMKGLQEKLFLAAPVVDGKEKKRWWRR